MKTSPIPGPQSMRFQLLSLLIFLTAGNPSWAQPSQSESQCRIWVQDRILESNSGLQKQLEAKSYKVTRLTGAPRIEEMSQILDLALYPGQDRKIHAFMNMNSRVLADFGAIAFKPEQLPHCLLVPAYADSTYFHGYIGRLARQRLDAFYTSGKLLTGIGELFLQAETLRFYGYKQFPAKFKAIQKDYRILVQEVRQTWESSAGESKDIFKRVEQVRQLLYPFYQNYLEQQPSLTFALQPPMVGNCQSSTQLFLFTIIDAGIELGPDWQLGAQLFTDHIQPVIYNNKTDLIQELVSGKRVLALGPVYSPELLTYALGRATGRAIPSERESQLLIRKADFKHTEKWLWMNYWILDKRTQASARWGDPFYLLYDPAFSSFGQGKPNPSFATIEFNEMSDSLLNHPSEILNSAQFNLSELGDFAFFKNKTNMRDAFGKPKKGEASPFGAPGPNGKDTGSVRSAIFQNIDKKYWPKITELYWQAYPANERPPAQDAEWEALWSVAYDSSSNNRFHLAPKIYLRSPKIQELSTFQEGLNIHVIPRKVVEFEEIQLGQSHLKLWNRPYKILVKNVKLLKELQDQNATIPITDNAAKYFSNENRARFRRLNREIFAQLYTYLRGESDLPSLKELRVFDNELKHFLAPLDELQTLSSSATWTREDKSVCKLRDSFKRNAPMRPDQIESALERLKKLDPETHRAYFGVMARLEQNEDNLNRLDACNHGGSESIFQQILTHLILERLNKNAVEALEPLSVVYPKLVFGESSQKIKVPKEALEGKAQQLQGQVINKVNLQRPQKMKSISVQGETLVGLIFSVEKRFLANPLVQIVVLDWLNEKNLTYVQNQWGDDNLAKSNIRTILDANLFRQEESWMPESLLAIHRQQQTNAAAWATFANPENASVPLSIAQKAYVTKAGLAANELRITDVPTIKQLSVSNSNPDSTQQTCNWYGSSFGTYVSSSLTADEILENDILNVYGVSSTSCNNQSDYRSVPNNNWEITIHDYKRERRSLISKYLKLRLENSKFKLHIESKTFNEDQIRQLFKQPQIPKYEDAVAEKINEEEGN